MKDKITITLDLDLLNVIDKEMIKHQQNNRSKFIAFVLRQTLYSPEQKFKLLEKSFQDAIRRQIAIADEKNRLEEYIAAKRAAEEKYKPENVKDALWQTTE